VTPPSAGVGVRGVVPGSPAARAGLGPGDVIISIDGQSVGAPGDVVRLIGEKGAGRRASIVFARGSTQRLVAVDLEQVPSDDEILRQSYVGSPAPAFESLKTVQGALDPSLGALRGKVVVVEFWAPWCFVCRMLVPVMNDWHSRYSAQGVVVMGIASESVEPTAQSAYQLGMTYPIASDETGRTSRAYRAVAVPTVFVVDRKGTVRDVLVGYSGRRLHEIDGLIANLVAER
jgi:peroxiredoxin